MTWDVKGLYVLFAFCQLSFGANSVWMDGVSALDLCMHETPHTTGCEAFTCCLLSAGSQEPRIK